MKKVATIKAECLCNFGYVETGVFDPINHFIAPIHNIIQMYSADGHILYSNRMDDEEMDDLDMHCIRCGASARFE